MPALRQTNFLGGELDPLLWGRTDLELFGKGLRTMCNFFPSHQGAAVSRPGTTYVGDAKLQSTARLIPFFYTDEQSYVLEVGHLYIRAWCRGVLVADIASDFQASEVFELQYAQVGDVMTLCHPAHWPRELRRAEHTTWNLVVLNFDVPTAGFPPNGIVASGTLPTEDVANGLSSRAWQWRVSLLLKGQSGLTYETKADPVYFVESSPGALPLTSIPAMLPVYPSKPITFRQRVSLGLTQDAVVCLRFYRGRGQLFGWVGDTDTAAGSFVDAGTEPNYERPPLKGENPFRVFDANGVIVRTECPHSVAFFQERRCFGGTNERPGLLLCSETGDYSNFDTRTFPAAGEALTYELASRRREQLRALLGLDRLLAFTSASVWSVSGQDGSPLDFDAVDARVVEEVGAVKLPPVAVGGAALYIRAKGAGVRAVVPSNTRSGYEGIDLSSSSRHLFQGAERNLVDWTYQEDPWGLIWAVRADGQLLSLTYELDSKTWAWARHDTAGKVLSVCAVPEGDEDAVYLLVSRERNFDNGMLSGTTWVTSIERMASRLRKGTTADDICVDQAVCIAVLPSIQAVGADPSYGISGLGVHEGKDVYVIAKGNPVLGPLRVTGGRVELAEPLVPNSGTDVTICYVGLLYTPELETLDVAATDVRLKQKTVTDVGLEVDQSRGLSVGPDFDHLTEWQQRDVSAGYSSVSAATELVTVPVWDGWNQSARIALRQTLPLPVTVVGLTRELQVGG